MEEEPFTVPTEIGGGDGPVQIPPVVVRQPKAEPLPALDSGEADLLVGQPHPIGAPVVPDGATGGLRTGDFLAPLAPGLDAV